MDVSVICTKRAYFSSEIDEDFCNEFLRKIPFSKMYSIISNYYHFWHTMYKCKKAQKGQISIFLLFSSNFNAFIFCKIIILLMGYWWSIKNILLFYLKKGPYLEGIFNTWNSKIQWVQHIVVSSNLLYQATCSVCTLRFNMHLFNFPLLTCFALHSPLLGISIFI